MLVEQEVQLIERGTRHLPVVLLVEIAERDGVGEHLVQVLDALTACVFVQADRHGDHRTVPLDIFGVLTRPRHCVSPALRG